MIHPIESTAAAPLVALLEHREADRSVIAARGTLSRGAFAELLALHLDARGITPRELERRSDITDTSWGKYLRGVLPQRSAIAAIALAIGVPVDELRALIEAQRDALKVGIRIDTLEQAQEWVAKRAAQTAEGA
jgi:transcriptional regulator with XRE-family HTH domain